MLITLAYKKKCFSNQENLSSTFLNKNLIDFLLSFCEFCRKLFYLSSISLGITKCSLVIFCDFVKFDPVPLKLIQSR